MTWTYNTALLATGDKLTQVRFLIGDTISTDAQMTDEEINFAISDRVDIYGAAAMCCRQLSSQMSRLASASIGSQSVSYDMKARAYNERANTYEGKAAIRGSGVPYAGGISVTDKASQEADTDRVTPQFNIGMHDNLIPVGPTGNEDSTDSAGT